MAYICCALQSVVAYIRGSPIFVCCLHLCATGQCIGQNRCLHNGYVTAVSQIRHCCWSHSSGFNNVSDAGNVDVERTLVLVLKCCIATEAWITDKLQFHTEYRMAAPSHAEWGQQMDTSIQHIAFNSHNFTRRWNWHPFSYRSLLEWRGFSFVNEVGQGSRCCLVQPRGGSGDACLTTWRRIVTASELRRGKEKQIKQHFNVYSPRYFISLLLTATELWPKL